MTDFLKKNIDGRRDEFEVYITDLDLSWDRISDMLDRKEHGRRASPGLWKMPLKVAAALLLVSAIAVVAYRLSSVGEAEKQPTLSMISPELAETEQYYTMMISEKLGQIKENSGFIDPAVMRDLETLDQVYAELRVDLADNLDNEEVVNAMIVNYKIKLKVLDRILEQIKEVKNEEEHAKAVL